MKCKMAADQVLKRFARQIRKEDAYYLYEVKVYARREGEVVTNVVTDPYSLGLAADSVKSLVVDLSAPLTKPLFGRLVPKLSLATPNDIVLYELHVRDFSISDATVPEQDRGKFTAFNLFFSNGMKHLWSLSQAGLTQPGRNRWTKG
jgi:pullulanase